MRLFLADAAYGATGFYSQHSFLFHLSFINQENMKSYKFSLKIEMEPFSDH